MASFRSFNFVLGGDMLSKALNALALLAAMRFLTVVEFADYVFVSAMALAAYGIFNGFFNRRIVFNRIPEEELAATELLALILTGFAYVLIASLAPFMGMNLAIAGVMLAGSAIIYDIRRSSLHRDQAFRRYTALEVVRAGSFLAATIAVIVLLEDDRGAWIIYSLAISYALAAVAMRSSVVTRGSLTRQKLKSCVQTLWTRESLMLMAFFVLMGLASQLPALLYRPLADTADYAEFGVAFRYYGLLASITAAFHIVALPAIANVTADDAGALIKRMHRIALFALILVAGATVVTYFLMPFIDGGKYPHAPALFVTMSVSLCFGIYCGILIASYQRSGRYEVLIFSQALCICVSAAIIWVFAAANPVAAAIATSVGIAVQLLTLLAFSRRTGLIGLLTERRVL